MINFSFDVFGIDVIPDHNIYGLWLLSFKFLEEDGDTDHRSLFCFHWDSGMIRFELLYITFLHG